MFAEPRCFLFLENLGAHHAGTLGADLARANTFCLFLPPNSSHITQPLDDLVFATIKSVGRTLYDRRQRRAQAIKGRIRAHDTKINMWRATFEAVDKAFDETVIIQSFSDVGLFPWNRERFLELVRKALKIEEARDAGIKAERVVVAIAVNKKRQQQEPNEDDAQFEDVDEVDVAQTATPRQITHAKEEEKRRAQAAEEEKERKRVSQEAVAQAKRAEQEKRKANKVTRTCWRAECARFHRNDEPPAMWVVCDACGEFKLCPQCAGDAPTLARHENRECRASKRRRRTGSGR